MTIEDAKRCIGKKVTVNGFGDLAVEFEMKILIYKKEILTIEKVQKNGKIAVLDSQGRKFSIPARNLDIYES